MAKNECFLDSELDADVHFLTKRKKKEQKRGKGKRQRERERKRKETRSAG